MRDICTFTSRPIAFLARYIKLRAGAHGVILAAVLGAVASSIGAQYGVKMLVDTLAATSVAVASVWVAFAILTSLIAADNLLWRLAMYVASFTFTAVTGDIRRDLFRHLTGHAPSYFTDRLPGTLTSPHHRHLQRRLYGGEHARLQRVTALCGDSLSHHFARDGQLAYGGGAGPDRRHDRHRHVPHRCRRRGPAPSICASGRVG